MAKTKTPETPETAQPETATPETKVTRPMYGVTPDAVPEAHREAHRAEIIAAGLLRPEIYAGADAVEVGRVRISKPSEAQRGVMAPEALAAHSAVSARYSAGNEQAALLSRAARLSAFALSLRAATATLPPVAVLAIPAPAASAEQASGTAH